MADLNPPSALDKTDLPFDAAYHPVNIRPVYNPGEAEPGDDGLGNGPTVVGAILLIAILSLVALIAGQAAMWNGEHLQTSEGLVLYAWHLLGMVGSAIVALVCLVFALVCLFMCGERSPKRS